MVIILGVPIFRIFTVLINRKAHFPLMHILNIVSHSRHLKSNKSEVPSSIESKKHPNYWLDKVLAKDKH